MEESAEDCYLIAVDNDWDHMESYSSLIAEGINIFEEGIQSGDYDSIPEDTVLDDVTRNNLTNFLAAIYNEEDACY